MTDSLAVEQALPEVWQRLLAEYGDFAVDRAAFLEGIRATLDERLNLNGLDSGLPVLEKLALSDLYLAHGCACGHPGAWRAFERQYGPALDRLALLFSTSTVTANDARQELLIRLFGGRKGRASGFRTYRGMSSLEGWLRVAMRRIVIDLHRSAAWRPLPGGDLNLEMNLLPDTTPTAEVRLVESRTARALVLLVREAVAALPAEDREILLRFRRDCCTYEELGRALGVHTSTAHRRLQRVEENLCRSVLRAARERLALDPRDVYRVRDVMADLFAFSDPTDTEPGT